MSSIYEEALIDSEKLKEIAVKNATNALVESVVPNIRKMVDSVVAGKQQEDKSVEDLLEEASKTILPSKKSQKDTRGEKFDVTSLISSLDHETLRLKEAVDNFSDFDPQEGKKFLSEIKSKVDHSYDQLEENKKIIDAENYMNIKERLENLESLLDEEKTMFESQEMLDELFLSEEEDELDLSDEETEETDVESEEDLEQGDEEVEEVEEEDEELDIDLDSVQSALGQLGDALGLDISFGGEGGEEDLEGLEDEEFDFDLETPEGGEEEVELDMEMPPAEGLEDALAYESSCSEGEDEDMLGEQEETCSCAEGECTCEKVEESVYDINENELKREILKMKKLRESRQSPTNDFKKLEMELSRTKQENKLLQSKLNESELFSAKLLYTNKLLQDKRFSNKQKLHVVKSLDTAKSLREVKLLFKTLTEGQEKSNETMTESIRRRRNIGSASRPMKTGSVSAQSSDKDKGQLSEQDDQARWMILAGLKKPLND